MDFFSPEFIAFYSRILIFALIFWVYTKNKSKLALYFSLFFLMFSAQAILRLYSSDVFIYFINRFTLLLGPIMILLGLSSLNVSWIKKYNVVPILIILSFITAYYQAFILGASSYSILTIIPGTAIGGILLFVAAYYFNKMGSKLADSGRFLLVCGLILQGLLLPVGVVLISMNYSYATFYLGSVFTLLIGLGWYMCLNKKE